MNTFLLFKSPNYYPSGGFNDLVAIGVDLETLITEAQKAPDQWTTEWHWHIVEFALNKMSIVATNDSDMFDDFNIPGVTFDPNLKRYW